MLKIKLYHLEASLNKRLEWKSRDKEFAQMLNRMTEEVEFDYSSFLYQGKNKVHGVEGKIFDHLKGVWSSLEVIEYEPTPIPEEKEC